MVMVLAFIKFKDIDILNWVTKFLSKEFAFGGTNFFISENKELGDKLTKESNNKFSKLIFFCSL